MPEAKPKPIVEELDYTDILVMGMFTHCHVCAVRESCMVYDPKEPRKQCPLEPKIYNECFNDYVKTKKVDPETYATQLHELAMLRVKLWRRERFESLMGTTEADLQGSSDMANKIARIITQKERALGTDRITTVNVKSLGAKKGDFVGAMKGIEKISKGKLELPNPKEIMEETDRLTKGAIVSIEHKKITVVDLQFDKLGVDMFPTEIETDLKEIEEVPYKRPKRKS